MVTCYPVFPYDGYMLPSVSLSWLHVTQCFFIMVTCYPVFLYYGHMWPSVSFIIPLLLLAHCLLFLRMTSYTYINAHNIV